MYQTRGLITDQSTRPYGEDDDQKAPPHITRVGYRLGVFRYRCQIDTFKMAPMPKPIFINKKIPINNWIGH